MLGFLVYFAGIWNILANTRLLDLLIRGGVIKYHDNHAGFVEGVVQHKFYLMSQDLINWELVLITGLIYLLFYLLKAIQFHSIARFCGLDGSLGPHARAYFYGLGISLFFTFRAGHVATAKAIEGQRGSPERAYSAIWIQELFVLFEIAFFATIGLVLTGWSLWLKQMFWALVILGVFHVFKRPARNEGMLAKRPGNWEMARNTFRALVNEPLFLVKLCLLSILAFFLDDVSPYVTSAAFTSEHVILTTHFLIIQAGVVSGYIARLVPFTPQAGGQFELGFVTALYVSGVGFPEAVTIAILDSTIRNVIGLLMFGTVTLWYGVETNLRSVLQFFLRPQSDPLT